MDAPVRSYLEVNGIKEGNIVVELKTEKGAIVYDGLSGDILETSSNLVLPGVPLSTGSLVQMTLWSYKTKDNEIRSLCDFWVNGKISSSRCLLLEGANIVPAIYVDNDQTANVTVSTVDNKLTSYKGILLNTVKSIDFKI